MTCNCHPDWHELGVHAPTPSAPNLQARLDLIRSQTAAPRSKGQRPGGPVVAPHESQAAGSPIFETPRAMWLSLVAGAGIVALFVWFAAGVLS